MRAWREVYGRAPSSTDWSRTHARRRGGEALRRLKEGDWPAPSTVIDLYGTWAGNEGNCRLPAIAACSRRRSGCCPPRRCDRCVLRPTRLCRPPSSSRLRRRSRRPPRPTHAQPDVSDPTCRSNAPSTIAMARREPATQVKAITGVDASPLVLRHFTGSLGRTSPVHRMQQHGGRTGRAAGARPKRS
jgi:hypothetical protein